MKTISKLTFKHLLCTVMLCLFTSVVQSQALYVVTASSNVRSAASGESSILGEVQKGDTVLVNKIEGYWGQIPFGLRYGYISMSYIKPVEENIENQQPIVQETYTTNSERKGVVSSQSQFTPIVDNGDGTYTCNGEVMNSLQLQKYFEDNCPAAYNEIYNSAKTSVKCWTAAIVLDAIIVAPLCAGIYCLTKNTVAGGVLIGLCGTIAAASIPCWIVGAVKTNNAISNGVEVYNAQCNKRYVQAPIQFQIQTSQNGIGIAMNF